MIAVYSIGVNAVRNNKVDEVSKANIDKIINELLGNNLKGKKGETYKYKLATEDHFLKDAWYTINENEEDLNETFDIIANKLVEAEIVKSGNDRRRHKNIKEGLLFIRVLNNSLILIKLEEVDSVKSEDFSIQPGYTIDKKYYKAAIYNGDSSNVTVIDKSTRVANYWSYGFLSLVRVRDDKLNTATIVKYINEDRIFNDDVSYNKKELFSKRLIKYMKSVDNFDIERFSTGYLADNSINENNYAEIYNKELVDNIDASFVIDETERSKLFKVALKTSSEVTIQGLDFYKSVKSKEIDTNDKGEIVVRVSKEYSAEVYALIERYREED